MIRPSLQPFVRKILTKLVLINHQKREMDEIRRDVEIIPVQPGLELEVYWKILKIGKGPAVILRAYDKEIMKFDCFGKDKGHYHISPQFQFRIYFPEVKAIDQIHRTCFELRRNAQKYVSLQSDNQINIDEEKFSRAVFIAEEKMTCFLQTIPEFADLR